MRVYERQVRIDAPFSDVWAFHATIDGLRALTPSWLHLVVHDIDRADGRESHVLDAGTTIRLSVRPFGVGPRQRWTAFIEERGTADGMAYFVDTMQEGPLPHWRHTHLFYDAGDETLLRDHVEYELPVHVGPLGDVGLAAFFRYRHRRTRQILET